MKSLMEKRSDAHLIKNHHNRHLKLHNIQTIMHENPAGATTNDKVSLISTNGPLVYAGSLPTPIVDPDLREGWLYQKTEALPSAHKFNYYLYANTSSSKAYTFKDIKTVHFTGSIDNYLQINSVPFIICYSKPTGVNDAEVWYHSKRTFTLDLTKHPIVAGEQINMYSGEKPNLKNSNRYVELSNLIVAGDGLETEEILYITIHSDSGAANTKILISSLGYNLNNEIKRTIKLV